MKTKSIRLAAVAAVLLAFCLVFMAPVSAEGTAVAMIGDNEYTSLQAAVDAAKDGNTIKLTGSVTVSGNDAIVIDKSLIIDLNGQTLTSSVVSNRTFLVMGEAVTFEIIGTTPGSKIAFSGDTYGLVEIKGSGNKLVITGGSYTGNLAENKFDDQYYDTEALILVTGLYSELTLNSLTVDTNCPIVRTSYVADVIQPVIKNIAVTGGRYTITGTEGTDYGKAAFITEGTSESKGTFNGVTISMITNRGGCTEIVGMPADFTDCKFTIKEGSESSESAPPAAICVSYGGSATLTGVSYVSEDSDCDGIYVYPTGGIVTINAGTTISSPKNALVAHTASNAEAKIVVNGGTITGSISLIKGQAASVSPSVAINGGTFIVSTEQQLKDVLSYIAEDATDVTIQLAKDIESLSGLIIIDKPVTITGGESMKKITRVGVEEGGIFYVTAGDTTFRNLELTSTGSKGSCIYITDDVNVTINDCKLTAENGNSEPLSIYNGNTVTLSNTIINAGDSGYGIITFNPVTLTIQDKSEITGYGALYFKDGSDSTSVTISESTITGNNKYSKEGGNSFGVFTFEEKGITVTLKESANVALASAKGTAVESIFLFNTYWNPDAQSGNTINVEANVHLATDGENTEFVTNVYENTLNIQKGVTSNFQIESKYLDTTGEEKLASVATKIDENGVVTEYTVQAVSDETVAPETPTTTTDNEGNKVISTTENPDTTIKKTGEGEVTIELPSGSDSTSEPTEDAPKISIVITGANTNSANADTGSMDSVTIPTNGEVTIVAKYENLPAAVAESESQATVALELKIVDVAGTLPVIDSSINEDVVETVKEQAEPTVTTTVLAMITAVGEDRNSNLVSGDDDKKITITFTVPASLIENLQNLVAYHVSANNGLTEAQMDDPVKDGDNYKITIYGKHFSSYVLVEEEPQKSSGGAVDTGSGNYQYYPRSVPTDGIIDFGTSKVVTGMELPAGSDGTVTLNIKPTFAMPENGFYAFEIDAPGYNLDAKINGGLSFQIPVADLEAAGWTAEDIVLFHGTVAEDGKITWEALPTNLVKNENGVAYYKAAINGCSPFYIGFVKDGSVVNTEVVDPVTPETPVTPDEPEVLPPVDEPETPEQPTESPAPILAVLAGLGAAAVLRRK